MLRKTLVIFSIIVLTGCSIKNDKGLFKKESDTLTKSPCATRCARPFFVDGRWI